MCRIALAVVTALRCSLLLGQSPAGAPASTAEQSRAEAEVRQLLKDLSAEQGSKGDAKELERVYADEFTAINAAGQVLNKAQTIAGRVSGRSVAQAYEVDEVKVQVYGDMAIAKTITRIEANSLSGRFRHLRVFIKRDGRWQILVTQMTKIAEP
jgi:ketosteroid isomerase-like protein